VARDEASVSAQITVDYHGIRLHFVTRNPKRRPEFMGIHLESGPFRHFEGEWHLAPLAPDAYRIEFGLRYEFHSAVMARIAGPVFDRIANALVDAFVGRAEQVYGVNGITGG
jgi:ribosome-associated toxin RatA of RatAB toxin-antitoxin module